MEFGGIWWGFFSNFPHQQQGNLNSVLVGLLEASSDTIKISHYKSLEWTWINQTYSIFLEVKWVPAEVGLAPHWNEPSSPPTSQLWPWQLWVKKNASFSTLVSLFHCSVAHCPCPAASILYSGSYRALYHLTFCCQAPCFPWEPLFPPLIFLNWLAHSRFITVSRPGLALRPPVYVHHTPRYKIGFG